MKTPETSSGDVDLEATPRVELGIKDLQSSALPLGYVAKNKMPPPKASGNPENESSAKVHRGFQNIQFGGDTQSRTGDKGFAVLGLTTWLCRPMP